MRLPARSAAPGHTDTCIWTLLLVRLSPAPCSPVGFCSGRRWPHPGADHPAAASHGARDHQEILLVAAPCGGINNADKSIVGNDATALGLLKHLPPPPCSSLSSQGLQTLVKPLVRRLMRNSLDLCRRRD
ncbi:hypothetical protein AV530_005182 [Patagioenas fasciata monilis]|uniref:Uncharacterized protein n=1 Tax=Patagioenas fasciata monilis TaxID=372326 RepID=A0A1V4K4J0_PATFA|nr:hypothetical protein AV530_005182 [Patagioenas fasciata monilis]